jgi:hypothetical protein
MAHRTAQIGYYIDGVELQEFRSPGEADRPEHRKARPLGRERHSRTPLAKYRGTGKVRRGPARHGRRSYRSDVLGVRPW